MPRGVDLVNFIFKALNRFVQVGSQTYVCGFMFVGFPHNVSHLSQYVRLTELVL
jgi:hypothetical protein